MEDTPLAMTIQLLTQLAIENPCIVQPMVDIPGSKYHLTVAVGNRLVSKGQLPSLLILCTAIRSEVMMQGSLRVLFLQLPKFPFFLLGEVKMIAMSVLLKLTFTEIFAVW